MRQEIQQVLEMNKSGAITDAQAAALMEELARGTRRSTSPRSVFGSIVDLISEVGGKGQSSKVDGLLASELADNSFLMSRVATIRGNDWTFKGNAIKMSSITGLTLHQSEMTDNVVSMSQLDDMALKNAAFSGNGISASSVEHIDIEQSALRRVTVETSKYEQISLTGESVMHDVRWNGSAVRGVTMERGSVMSDTTIFGVQLNNVRLSGSEFRDGKIDGAIVSELECEDSQLVQCFVRTARLRLVRFANSTLTDVLISGGDKGWKKSGFEEVSFDHCQLDKALFAECHLEGVTIKNVTLSDLRITGLRLSNQTIDGNAALLALLR